MYNKAMSLGAYGGKLLGAGKGGFLLILSNKKNSKKNKENIWNSKYNKY